MGVWWDVRYYFPNYGPGLHPEVLGRVGTPTGQTRQTIFKTYIEDECLVLPPCVKGVSVHESDKVLEGV